MRTIQGSRPGHPTGLATDGTHVWVADSSNCSVSKIMLKDGALVTRTGSYGAGTLSLALPRTLTLPLTLTLTRQLRRWNPKPSPSP